MGVMLTVNEVAKRFGVSRETVYQWVRNGRLPSFRPSRRVIRIPEEALENVSGNGRAAQTNLEAGDQQDGVVIITAGQLTRIVETAVRRAVQEALAAQDTGPSAPNAGVASGDLLTIDEVAQRFGVGRETVYRWVRDGRLPSVRLSPRVIRIPEAALGAPNSLAKEEGSADEEQH